MKIDIYNSERYYDPTPYVALNSILNQEEAALRAAAPGGDGYRPVVYVCSPYSGNVEENVQNARHYCRFALENRTIPLAPHLLYPQFMDDNDPAERYLATHTINYVLLGKCRELWVFGMLSQRAWSTKLTLRSAGRRIFAISAASLRRSDDDVYYIRCELRWQSVKQHLPQ